MIDFLTKEQVKALEDEFSIFVDGETSLIADMERPCSGFYDLGKVFRYELLNHQEIIEGISEEYSNTSYVIDVDDEFIVSVRMVSETSSSKEVITRFSADYKLKSGNESVNSKFKKVVADQVDFLFKRHLRNFLYGTRSK